MDKEPRRKNCLDHGDTILRIIYPVRAHYDQKLDYIRGAVKKYVDGKMYPLFKDQQVCIAYIDEVAETLDKIITTRVRIFIVQRTPPLPMIWFVLLLTSLAAIQTW